MDELSKNYPQAGRFSLALGTDIYDHFLETELLHASRDSLQSSISSVEVIMRAGHSCRPGLLDATFSDDAAAAEAAGLVLPSQAHQLPLPTGCSTDAASTTEPTILFKLLPHAIVRYIERNCLYAFADLRGVPPPTKIIPEIARNLSLDRLKDLMEAQSERMPKQQMAPLIPVIEDAIRFKILSVTIRDLLGSPCASHKSPFQMSIQIFDVF